MNYRQRKMAAAQRKAKKYKLEALIHNLIVALSAINIFGNCISAVISPIYFLLNAAISIIIIRICYTEAAGLEKKASRTIRDCQRKLGGLKCEKTENIIHVDFDFKRKSGVKFESNSDII